MTNGEVFREMFNVQWVIEQNLFFLLKEYDDAVKENPNLNKVAFIKDFMKKDTYIEVKYAEAAMDEANKTAIEVDESGNVIS